MARNISTQLGGRFALERSKLWRRLLCGKFLKARDRLAIVRCLQLPGQLLTGDDLVARNHDRLVQIASFKLGPILGR